LTVTEARWAVFFETLRDDWGDWDYDPEGWGLGNEHHYRPQFRFSHGYLEVQRPGDNRTRERMRHPEGDEHPVYLAVGDFPDEKQLRAAGWWDPKRGQGVRMLTPGYEWEDWFPPAYDKVLWALEAAGSEKFESGIPSARRPEEEVRDIPEREREQRPD
jgi:hypothetical protein